MINKQYWLSKVHSKSKPGTRALSHAHTHLLKRSQPRLLHTLQLLDV